MDVENLDKNQRFSELPDTWTIFITENDLFGKGRPYYLFRFIDVETGEQLNDGATILYVNGAYRGNDPIGKLMHDFNCTNAQDMHYDEMAERTKYLKESQGGVAHMCKVIEEMRKQEFAEGLARGRILGAFEAYREILPDDADVQKKVQEKFHLNAHALEHYWSLFISQTAVKNG